MWSAPVVRDLKIDYTQRHLFAHAEPEARNSAVGWHWNKKKNEPNFLAKRRMVVAYLS